jgi:hypothetical protein
MAKDYFNDPRPSGITYQLLCCSCRASMVLTVFPYPHGPGSVIACPVCGADAVDNLQIRSKEVTTNE